MPRTTLLSLAISISLLSSFAVPTLAAPWSKSFGDADLQDPYSVAVDASGNVLVTGHFFGSIDFGGGVLTCAGGYDAFVAKFNSAGVHLWSKRFGGTFDEFGTLGVFDNAGNVVITGTFNGDVDFGGGVLTTEGGWDIFVAKFNAAGTHQWSSRFGDDFTDIPAGIATDAGNHVVIAGRFGSTAIDFGGGPLINAGDDDIFVAQFDGNGVHQWSKSFGGLGRDRGTAIAVDNSGNAVLTGFVQGDVDFGGGVLTVFNYAVFLAKLDVAGAHVWSYVYDTNGESIVSVAIDEANNIVITGPFSFSIYLGGDPLFGNQYSMFLAKYDSAANLQWRSVFDIVVNDEFPLRVTADDVGHILVAGTFEGTIDFGGSPRTTVGGSDAFVVQFGPGGEHEWTQSFGDNSIQAARSITAYGDGNFAITGLFLGNLDFGSGLMTGAYDVFVANSSGPRPEITNIDDVPGDQGGWARITFRNSPFDITLETVEPVINYHVLRRVDEPVLIGLVEGATRTLSTSSGDRFITIGERRFVRSSEVAAGAAVWEAVGTVPARQQLEYVGLVPTLADSTENLQLSVYFVMAQTIVPSFFFDSPPDSGYSVDNISPAVPQGFAAAQLANPARLRLHWDPSLEPDFMYYALHRGTAGSFVPGPSNLIGTTIEIEFIDDEWTWNSGYYYKLAAVDSHGNRSGVALLTPIEFTGGGSVPAAAFLSQNEPNPFSGSTRIAFGLREAGSVSLRVYDVAGKLVRVLASERRAAQTYGIEWDSRDGVGAPVASGVYFYRLEMNGFTQTRKMLLLK